MTNTTNKSEEMEAYPEFENIVVDQTTISYIDGMQGQLYYRGINIAELAAHASFEEAAWLLLCGKLPSKSQLEAFRWALNAMTKPQEKILRIIEEFPQNSSPLLLLQMGLSSFACIDFIDDYLEEENHLEKVMRIIAQTPVMISAAYRHHLGVSIIEPRNDLNYVDNFIYMLCGKIPSKLHSRAMEIALILQMEHGFNSSTFTVRTVASTQANFYTSVSAAVGALSGPLHGGASELVIEMLQDARASGNVKKFVRDLLNAKGKIMGMGHRVYKTVDPRAIIFKDLLEKLTPKNEPNSDLELLKIIEQEARNYFDEKMIPVYTNVDFWSGSVYKRLGLLPILYPSIFAVARMVGWSSHILELRQRNKLYRPKSVYVGPHNVAYVPIEKR
jgi:citrate synthase